MWTEHLKEDVVGKGRQHEYQKSSMLSQFGFGYIQRAADQLKRRMIKTYEQRDKPFEERVQFIELEKLTKDRKRDKKQKEKKKKKKDKKRKHSSSSNSDSEQSVSKERQDANTEAQNELLMSSSQFVSEKQFINSDMA